jgi:hypothetical protein
LEGVEETDGVRRRYGVCEAFLRSLKNIWFFWFFGFLFSGVG